MVGDTILSKSPTCGCKIVMSRHGAVHMSSICPVGVLSSRDNDLAYFAKHIEAEIVKAAVKAGLKAAATTAA